MATALPAKRFTVYAIKLAPTVLTSRKFREANPDYVEGMECFYIGMTAKTPPTSSCMTHSGPHPPFGE